jgi:SagB-type dehydrogenase family enzyme
VTTDHRDRPLGGQSELWSLREDVRVQLEPADGPVRLHTRWGNVTIQRPPPVVREALRRMLLGPISLENVIGAPYGPSGRRATADSLTLLHDVLDRLQPFIIRTLGIESGQPLLSIVPLTPHSRFRPVPLPADMRVRLSTFAQLRTDGNEYRLESPLSLHRVLLHRPEAIWLLSSLGRPIAAVAAASAWPHPDSLATEALAYLTAIGMVVRAQDTGDEPDITEDTSLAGWSAADLMFHTRSNSGRHDDPVGRTYPMGKDGSPEPVARPPRADPGIPLHRPTWESLSAADPPLGLVMEGRRSTRSYGAEPVTAEELGDLLYRTARIRAVITPPDAEPEPDAGERDPRLSDRPYPGGGACYELELYITVGRCPGIPRGVYHYDPLRHCLELVNADGEVADQLLLRATETTGMEAPPPVLITMTARFRRLSWKYEGIVYATVLKDVGVLLQNLYLVCTAMGLAPCALGTVNLDLTARAFGIDWQLEPSVGQFILGRAPDTPPRYTWRWQPVNDAQWADNARALLRGR